MTHNSVKNRLCHAHTTCKAAPHLTYQARLANGHCRSIAHESQPGSVAIIANYFFDIFRNSYAGLIHSKQWSISFWFCSHCLRQLIPFILASCETFSKKSIGVRGLFSPLSPKHPGHMLIIRTTSTKGWFIIDFVLLLKEPVKCVIDILFKCTSHKLT